jgi:hypothetical protein
VAIQPGPPTLQRASGGRDTAELRLRPARRGRRRLVAIVLAVIGLCGLAVAAAGIRGQLRPRTFTPAQQKRIQAWEVAKRWRTTPKSQIFPLVIRYTLPSAAGSKGGGLKLSARRLEIARQATCVQAAGGSLRFMSVLGGEGCAALLRSTYTDSSSSLVLTTGIAVLKDQASAMAAAVFLTGGAAAGQGGVARQLVLSPLRVSGTPAARYGYKQRQLSLVVAAGPYLVMATVGYADGRPRTSVSGDAYAYQEMTSLARGVAVRIAAPLGATPPVPRCPGAPSC